MVNRFCYKCSDCLAVFFVEPAEAVGFAKATPAVECACGGLAELMGRVSRDNTRILSEGYACACDGRCTGARGPLCDCHCGGVNHGTGAVVPVVTDVTRKVPKALNKANAEVAKEFHEAVAAAEARIESKFGADLLARFRRGEWIDGGTYWDIRKAFRLVREAREGKVHKNRMAKLASVAELTAEEKSRLEAERVRLEAEKKAREERELAREAERKAREEEKHVAAPEGRVKFKGTVVSKKEHESPYGLVFKITVKVETPEGSWLAWGTLPSALVANRGDTIELVGTLERSKDKPYFAFFKRPTNGVVTTAVAA